MVSRRTLSNIPFVLLLPEISDAAVGSETIVQIRIAYLFILGFYRSFLGCHVGLVFLLEFQVYVLFRFRA